MVGVIERVELSLASRFAVISRVRPVGDSGRLASLGVIQILIHLLLMEALFLISLGSVAVEQLRSRSRGVSVGRFRPSMGQG